MIPPDIKVLEAVPNDELKWIGTLSSSIFGPATENTPQQKPKINLPMTIVSKFKIIVSPVAAAAKMFHKIIAFLRPLVMNFPPEREPATIPKMAAALIMVLYRTASSEVHPNFY